MLVLPRGLARSFRAALHKCSRTRLRGPLPPVLVESDGKRLRLSCVIEGIGLAREVPHTSGEMESCAVPMAVFDAVEGASVEIVVSGSRGTARWEGRDGPKRQEFEVPITSSQSLPSLPDRVHPLDREWIAALFECGQTSAREASRYAIHRVQVNGKAGTVVGTDGKLALVYRGFSFPFRDSILIPATSIFGLKELQNESEVRVSL